MMLKSGMNVPNIPASFHFVCEKHFPRFIDFGMKSAQLREKGRYPRASPWHSSNTSFA